MRITQGMISNNMLTNLTKSYSNLNKYMDQLNTGNKISKPSDNPFIAIKGMDYRTQLAQVEQYKSNTTEVDLWMDNSDSALDGVSSGLKRMQELAIQASNGTYSESERKNVLEEAKQIKADLISIANRKVNDRYIFNGTDTNHALITEDANGVVTVNSGQQPVKIHVADNIELQANVNGEKVFGGDFFKNIDGFIKALGDNNQADIEKGIDTLQANIDTVINQRADLGARMNRMDLIKNRLDSQEITAKDVMSKNEKVDYEKAITDLLTQETMHRAALAAGSRVIQPSLVDFLR